MEKLSIPSASEIRSKISQKEEEFKNQKYNHFLNQMFDDIVINNGYVNFVEKRLIESIQLNIPPYFLRSVDFEFVSEPEFLQKLSELGYKVSTSSFVLDYEDFEIENPDSIFKTKKTVKKSEVIKTITVSV